MLTLDLTEEEKEQLRKIAAGPFPSYLIQPAEILAVILLKVIAHLERQESMSRTNAAVVPICAEPKVGAPKEEYGC